MPNIHFRLARSEDLSAIMAFVQRVCTSAYRNPALIAKCDRQRIFQNEEFVAVFVAEFNNYVVGCITVQRTLLPWATNLARCVGHLAEPSLNTDDEISRGLITIASNHAKLTWGATHIER